MKDSEAGINHVHQLRSYIAPAAPATRAPCDGSESAMRIEFGFTPRWYRDRLGIDFGERWHTDPIYRRETVVAMKKELNRRFPSLRLGGADPDTTPGTLDGVHGALTMSMIFGIPVEYYPDRWPDTQPHPLTVDEIARLEAPNLPDVPVIRGLLEQIEEMERTFGRVEGYINWQGVLNTAFRIRGYDVCTDLITSPELAQGLFEAITQVMIGGMRLLYARQAKTGFHVRHATLSNCLVNMLSPDLYREHVMPYDKRISDAFEHFGIHNCAWNVDPYIEDYASIRTLGYVDMGLDSDLRRAKRLCPDTRRAIMYTPSDLANKSLEAIRNDLEQIRRDLSPCDIVMADIDTATPDERVLDVARIADETLDIAPQEP